MRSIAQTMQELLDLVPENDPGRPALQQAFNRIAQSAMYISPEDLPRLWLRVRAALLHTYPGTHPLYPSLARTFAGHG